MPIIGGTSLEIYVWFVFFLLGLVFGSFFNVVGLRVPIGISFVSGRSHCPTCYHRLHWLDLIPVLSFCWQKGTCRYCQAPVSVIYPAMELLTGVLFAYGYVKIGLTVELATALLLVSMLVIITVSDIAYMVIPNHILLFFLPLLFTFRLISPLDPWYDAFLGAVVGFVIIALIILISKGGMGAGDMKLFFVLGIVLGWKNILLTLFIAALLGSIFGVLLQFFR